MNNLLNILHKEAIPVDDQQIINYLQGQLNAGDRHNLEESEQADALMQDAMEGLQMMKDSSRLNKITLDINRNLQQRIQEQRKKRKETARWKDQNWILMAAITLLVLTVICFVVIKRLYHQ